MKHDAFHVIRVHKDMREAGLGNRALATSEGKHLPHIIHPDEHIGGAIYGTCQGSFAMLIATDLRIIYLDKKPIFTQFEELSYDVVSGVEVNDLMMYAGVTLHTRIKDFAFRWVNKKCVPKFVEFIEQRKLEEIKIYDRQLAQASA